MFDPHFRFGTPTGGDLLAELGVRPDRGAAYPEHGFASLSPEPLPTDRLRESGPDEPRAPAPARRQVGRRWRRA